MDEDMRLVGLWKEDALDRGRYRETEKDKQ